MYSSVSHSLSLYLVPLYTNFNPRIEPISIFSALHATMAETVARGRLQALAIGSLCVNACI